jgi:hypothetical protein
MNSNFETFKKSAPIPNNFGQVPTTQTFSKINLAPIILLGAIAFVVVAAVAYNFGKLATLKKKEE